MMNHQSDRSPTILYRDAHVLICRKPAGMPSQPDPSGQMDLLSQLSRIEPTVKLIHRLDTPTGGIMVFGCTQDAIRQLGISIQDHTTFIKEYLAVLPLEPEEPEGIWEDYLYHDKQKNKAFIVSGDRKGAKSARLAYKTVAVDRDGRALVLVRLYTGRTHQIRVQCASRGLPLVGDGKYGSREKCPYIGLFSHRLTFPHPITGARITVSATPDEDIKPWDGFQEFWAENALLFN